MTTAQLTHMREAIAMREVSRESIILSCAYALQEAMQAIDYGEPSDLRFAAERARYVSDVLEHLEGR